MRKRRLMALIVLLGVLVALVSGCRQASRVSYNVSKEADNFNVCRKLTVINARTDRIVYELIGNFSLDNNGSDELEVLVKVEEGVYKKHYIYLNDWTLYFVEDISGAEVSQYHYEVSIFPEKDETED